MSIKTTNKYFYYSLLLIILITTTLISCQQDKGIDIAAHLEKIKAIPYINYTTVKDDRKDLGVIHFEKSRTYNGLNLYCSRLNPACMLMDMNGKIVHKWHDKTDKDNIWQTAYLDKDGSLFVVVYEKALIKLDKNSNELWRYDGRFHHDLDVSSSGDIYGLSRRDTIIEIEGQKIPILQDFITILRPDGSLKKEISIFDVVQQNIPKDKIKAIKNMQGIENIIKEVENSSDPVKAILHYDSPFDVFHTNTINIIKTNKPGFYKPGDLLICIRQFDLVGIVDPDRLSFKWKWGPNHLERPHQPSLLSTGNILIFDNGVYRNKTRIIEVDPNENEIVWQYPKKLNKKFFSVKMGRAERLPNGNTLITMSVSGRVLEIDLNENIVWDFYFPEFINANRHTIYNLERVPQDFDFLVSTN